jgi:hypothetical protein
MQVRNETRRLEEYGSVDVSAMKAGEKEEENTTATSDAWVNIRLG